MARTFILSVSALVLVCAVAASARAQIGGYYQGKGDNPVGPTVSPYLNLIQSNNFGVTNYQSLVRPLIDQGTAINRQGNSLNRIQQQINSPSAAGYGSSAGSRGTGHTTFFMNVFALLSAALSLIRRIPVQTISIGRIRFCRGLPSLCGPPATATVASFDGIVQPSCLEAL